MPDGKAASARGDGLGEMWRSVTRGRVVKMPGGEVVGKWQVMWGLEIGVPSRDAVGEHVRELSTCLKGLR